MSLKFSRTYIHEAKVRAKAEAEAENENQGQGLVLNVLKDLWGQGHVLNTPRLIISNDFTNDIFLTTILKHISISHILKTTS